MDCSPPGSIHGIFQARILEWVAIPFSRGSSRPRDRTQVSRIAARRFTVCATREASTHSVSALSLTLWFPLLIRSFVQPSRDPKRESEICSVVSDSLQPHGLYSPWISQGQNTGVGSLSLLQGIFPTQGPNPGLLHCRRILYQLNHKGNPYNIIVL